MYCQLVSAARQTGEEGLDAMREGEDLKPFRMELQAGV